MKTSGVYDCPAMRQIEKQYIEFLGSEYNLLQIAGEAVFKVMNAEYPNISCCLFFVGTGNNGVDGIIAASHLAKNGVHVDLVQCDPAKIKTKNYSLCLASAADLGVNILHAIPNEMDRYDLLIDAMLGTGVNRPVGEKYRPYIDLINSLDTQVVSIDLPSGIQPDACCVMGEAVKANLLIGLLTHKLAYYSGPSLNYFGRLVVDTLGVEQMHPILEPKVEIDTFAKNSQMIKRRPVDAHKGTFGRVIVIGPLTGNLAGASLLTAIAAAKVGCGQVILVGRDETISQVSAKHPYLTVISFGFLKSNNGYIKESDIVVIGPGFGVEKKEQEFFVNLLKLPNQKVLDADALTLLKPNHIKYLGDRAILTPHPKEAQKLMVSEKVEVQNNRLGAIRSLIEDYQTNIVLKGAGTLLCSIEEKDQLYVCLHKSGVLSVAGMGDILSGMIASLWAQKLTALNSMRLGVTWHAALGEKLDSTEGKFGVDLEVFLQKLRSPFEQGWPDDSI